VRRTSLVIFSLLTVALAGACHREAAVEATANPSDDEEATPKSTQAPALAAIAPARVSEPQQKSPCPDNMILVDGNYCPEVQQVCKRYMDPPGRYEYFRCAEYQQPAKCLSNKKHLRYCIDRDEYVPPGETLPANDQSWTMADRTCKSMGKRVCMESEWNFACEGEEMRPYPYGFKRDATACNADHTDIINETGQLKDLRAPADAYPRCVSPFGVRNLSGNLEEFVSIDGSKPVRPAMKGAYWQPSRNFCRAAQTAHDQFYHGTETGFRCCADTKK
jgi:hypothetical protein